MKGIFLIAAIVFITGCVEKNKPPTGGIDAKLELLDADRAFSAMSEEKGMKNAFLEFIDSNGVLLRPDQLPIKGADAIDYLIQQNDQDYNFTWQPKDGFISASGDLGYTYGVYTLKPKTKDTVIQGTYVSIWKKQADGKWKFVLDSGNEGVGE